MENENKLMIS